MHGPNVLQLVQVLEANSKPYYKRSIGAYKRTILVYLHKCITLRTRLQEGAPDQSLALMRHLRTWTSDAAKAKLFRTRCTVSFTFWTREKKKHSGQERKKNILDKREKKHSGQEHEANLVCYAYWLWYKAWQLEFHQGQEVLPHQRPT